MNVWTCRVLTSDRINSDVPCSAPAQELSSGTRRQGVLTAVDEGKGLDHFLCRQRLEPMFKERNSWTRWYMVKFWSWRGGDRRVLSKHWPASLAHLVSTRPMTDSVLKTKQKRHEEWRWGCLLASEHVYIHVYIHILHIHVHAHIYIYTDTHTVRENSQRVTRYLGKPSLWVDSVHHLARQTVNYPWRTSCPGSCPGFFLSLLRLCSSELWWDPSLSCEQQPQHIVQAGFELRP